MNSQSQPQSQPRAQSQPPHISIIFQGTKLHAPASQDVAPIWSWCAVNRGLSPSSSEGLDHVLASRQGPLSAHHTRHQATYGALLGALHWILEMKDILNSNNPEAAQSLSNSGIRLEFLSDDNTVLNQVIGRRACDKPTLQALLQEVRKLIAKAKAAGFIIKFNEAAPSEATMKAALEASGLSSPEQQECYIEANAAPLAA